MTELLNMVQCCPRLAGLERSRWWLDGLRQAISWLRTCSLAGVSKLLRRLGIVYKRGREYVHSPDPDYKLKLAYLAAARAQVHARPQHQVMLYLDEMTYTRRPSVGYDYAPRRSKRPLARLGWGTNCQRRIAGALDVETGRFITWQRSRFDRRNLLAFFRALQAAYPYAERIFLVLDNWPVHFHPDILLALANSNITLLRLPTYAPWTNPVEQVWRRLRQEVLHLHDFLEDWSALQTMVQRWLDQWRDGSLALLHYVGLLPN